MEFVHICLQYILKKIYVDLLNNQNNSNSIYLLGYFNFYGIGTDLNQEKGFKLYQKAAELQNRAAQLNLIREYFHENICLDPKLAFELCEKLAKEEYADGLNDLGYCYEVGVGTNVDKQKAFELYQKAANLGNINRIKNFYRCYKNGLYRKSRKCSCNI
ncbi:unnamed protein product [Rhizophagus irregularis]|nr:unnamed protein product [Rhizophagus irregularis]